jgi:hypothetical protein
MLKRMICCLFILVVGKAHAQQKPDRQVTHQQLYWLRYYNTLFFSPKTYLASEFESRRFAVNNRTHQTVLRNTLHHKVNPGFSAALGFAYFTQAPHDPFAKHHLVVPEYRIFQEFNHKRKAGHWGFHHMLRTEARFIGQHNGRELVPGTFFNFRARYRFGIEYALKSWQEGEHFLKARFYEEIMFHGGETITNTFFDQNRVYLAVQAKFMDNVSFELGYLHWYQQRRSGFEFYDRDILRFTVYQQFDLKKASRKAS